MSFTVDTITVNLEDDYSGQASISSATGHGAHATSLVEDVQTALGSAYTVSNNDGKLKIEKNVADLDDPQPAELTAPSVSVTDDKLAFSTHAAVTSGAVNWSGGVAVADLTINGVAIASSTYTGAQLASRINSQVGGVFASFSSNQMTIKSASAITIGGGSSAGFTAGRTAIGTGDTQTLNAVDVSSADLANVSLMRIDSALTAVNALRGQFGAMQNRFDSAVASLQVQSENSTAARSRIQDADFASETANLTRSQILQQAGTAMLAQANSLPQSVLSLLK